MEKEELEEKAISNEEKEFISKYGIENIIKLDKETNGIFSHELEDRIYLIIFARADKRTPNYIQSNNQIDYEQFKKRIYDILKYARTSAGILYGGMYEDYDFVQGKFREEYNDIFLDEKLPREVKMRFYTGHMRIEDVKKYPQLMNILENKSMEGVFNKKIYIIVKNNDQISYKQCNMAEYLSKTIGKKEFLKLCYEYGENLEKFRIVIEENMTADKLRNIIENEIYKKIKEEAMLYSENLPDSFKLKHPELFLSENIDIGLREEFYNGRFTFEDIRKNPQILEELIQKDIDVGFRNIKYYYKISKDGRKKESREIWKKLTKNEILEFSKKYGKYLNSVDIDLIDEKQETEEKEKIIKQNIEENILNRKATYNEDVPEFFKEKYSEMFLEEGAPEELKKIFYDNNTKTDITFRDIQEHPEYKEFLKEKDLKRAFNQAYSEIFDKIDTNILLKFSSKTIDMAAINYKASTLANWIKATGARFIPQYTIIENFPENEIDNFLKNSRKWSQLMKIERYTQNDDFKSAMLKLAYIMGVFHGVEDAFRRTMEILNGLPKTLDEDDMKKIKLKYIENISELEEIEKAYIKRKDGKYILRFNNQKDKERNQKIRIMLENSGVKKVLTPELAHILFDSFAMTYDIKFVKFFIENYEKILTSEDISSIQRQFKDILKVNASRKITYEVAEDYVKNVIYNNVDVGNEQLAEEVKRAKYDQSNFEKIQKIYNKGEKRKFSSIPRITGKSNGYTYEMLRLDDTLPLTIGVFTDCCQKIDDNAKTSMEHSMVSSNGRVFCVRDSEGRIVAQSWFWRNQNVGCFDDIEISKRIFKLYEEMYGTDGRKKLAKEVLEVYKKATQELMEKDKTMYKELLKNKKITQEQYDSLVFGKITVGMGFNEIAETIKNDESLQLEKVNTYAKSEEGLSQLYTDAHTQYIIKQREDIKKSKLDNLYVYEDEIPVYDKTNITSTRLLTIKRMGLEEEKKDSNIIKDEKKSLNSKEIINEIATDFYLDPEKTKVMMSARIAIIYSEDKEKIQIGDILFTPIKNELSKENKIEAKNHMRYQVKKALRQLKICDKKVDMMLLNDGKREFIQTIIDEIKSEEKDNTGWRCANERY